MIFTCLVEHTRLGFAAFALDAIRVNPRRRVVRTIKEVVDARLTLAVALQRFEILLTKRLEMIERTHSASDHGLVGNDHEFCALFRQLGGQACDGLEGPGDPSEILHLVQEIDVFVNNAVTIYEYSDQT